MPTIIVPAHAKLGQGFTKQQVADSLEHPGRRTDGSQSAAHWVMNLTDLGKLIILCSFCRAKFNPRKHGYRKFYMADPSMKTDGYAANGKCDACKQPTVNCGGGTAYVAEQTYQTVCIDPVDQRRLARQRARAASTIWAAAEKSRRKVK